MININSVLITSKVFFKFMDLVLFSCDVISIIGDIIIVTVLLWPYQSLDVISIGIIYNVAMSL